MVLRTEKARQKNTIHVVPRHWRTGRKDLEYSRRIGKDVKDGWKRTALYKDIHNALLLWEYFRSLHSLAQNKTPSSKNTAEVETQTLQ